MTVKRTKPGSGLVTKIRRCEMNGIRISLVIPALVLLPAGLEAEVWPEAPAKERSVAIGLVDGSRIIGAPGFRSLGIQTHMGHLEIPLDRIRSFKSENNGGPVVFNLNNGDSLEGRLADEALELTTVFGRISLDVRHVRSLVLNAAAPLPPVLTNGLVLHYSFDDEAGAQIKDQAGHGHQGVSHGTVPTPHGKCGSALAFDGQDAFAEIAPGTLPDLPAWKNYTISVWFLNDGKGDHGQGYGQKILDQTEMYHDFYLCVRQDGSLAFTTYEGSAAGMEDSSRDFRDGKWHHAVVIKKGSHGELWVDGKLSCTNDSLKSVTSKSPLLAGNSKSSDPLQRKAWSGKIDELMIFNTALPAEGIRLIHDHLN